MNFGIVLVGMDNDRTLIGVNSGLVSRFWRISWLFLRAILTSATCKFLQLDKPRISRTIKIKIEHKFASLNNDIFC